MEGFGACCQHQKQAAFFGHHGSPPKWYCEEPRINLPANLFHEGPSWCVAHVGLVFGSARF